MSGSEKTPAWRRYLRFFRSDVQRDVDDEIRFHFESRVEDLTAQGKSESDARAQAVAEFGDVGQTRDSLAAIDKRTAHARARTERLRDITSDLAYAVRALRRTPGVSIAILATLALGVGANASMYALLDAVFLRPPAGVAAPTGVHRVWNVVNYYGVGKQFSEIMSYPQFHAISDELGTRGTATVYRRPQSARIGTGEAATRAQVAYAPASYFSLLGVRPMLGRIYSGDEDAISNVPNVAVISESYWRGQLRGDSAAIGSRVTISGNIYTIVGITGGRFAGSDLDATEIWLPMGVIGRGRTRPMPWWDDRGVNGMVILIRPSAGTNISEIEQRTQVALRQAEARRAGDSLTIAKLGSLIEANGPGKQSQETQIAVRLAGVAVIVLLIACANVTNLLLGRAIRRRREIAVRLALGISRARLVQLLLVEAFVLAVAAALVSLIIAYWGGSLLRTLLMPDVHWATSPLNGAVATFTLGVALVAGVFAGVVPAFQSARPELVTALKSGGGAGVQHHSRLRTSLVIAQAALSVVLLVGALLFVRSLSNIRGLDLGWDTQRLVTISVAFYDRAKDNDPTLDQRIRELSDAIARIPGVERTALTSVRPMADLSFISYYTEKDSLGSRRSWVPTVTGVSRGFFAASGMKILRGSDFAPLGAPSEPTVIVNETMAKGLWPDHDAIGQCMHLETRGSPCYSVRAVVSDSRMGNLIETAEPKFFLSVDNLPPESKASLRGFYVAASIMPERSAPALAEIRALVRSQFPGGTPSIMQLNEFLERQYRPWRLGATLFTAFGVLSLIVAAIGMYSTVAYGVTQRLHEFGVRIALGAQGGDVLRLVVTDGLRTVIVGIGIGIVLAILGGRFIATLLFGVVPNDPQVMGTIAAVLLFVALVAALVPAWRASRVDPVTALRAD